MITLSERGSVFFIGEEEGEEGELEDCEEGGGGREEARERVVFLIEAKM